MAKTKTKSRSNSKDILRSSNTPLVKSAMKSKSPKSTQDFLTEATTHLEHSQPEAAWPLAQEALRRLEIAKEDYANSDTLLQAAAQDRPTFPVALTLGAEICLALGDVDKARAQYEAAARIDPDGALVSAEPWLQLAQLCEEGGQQSVEYFEKAVEIMRNEIEVLEGGDEDGESDTGDDAEETRQIVHVRRAKVAEALCGMAEVYMTDLSWEEDAEQRCEQLVTEAVATCPDALSAGVLQTLASIRISQTRIDEAKRVLGQSLALWKDIPADVDSLSRPDFATRVSLVRLLMEVEQEDDAMGVVEGLVKEDDQSVEALYLGGWCQLLLSQQQDVEEQKTATHAEQARIWLGKCLRLYRNVQYEDEPLRTHAEELVQQLNQSLNITEDDDDWEDADENEEPGSDDDIEAEEGDHNKDEDVEMT